MTVDTLREFLGWCSVINIALLLYWWLLFMLAHDWVYRLHTKWFKLSPEKFDGLHYSAMAFYKLIVIVFNIIPYIALRIIT